MYQTQPAPKTEATVASQTPGEVQHPATTPDGGYADQTASLEPAANTLAVQLSRLRPVQTKGSGGNDAAPIHTAAAHGLSGAGGPLPHLEKVQRSFGRHDVGDVRAHSDGPAREACARMGAEGYAAHGAVAFAGSPDVHTAAHEAAHVVQQKGGVALKGNVGEAGDRYEQHADAVADRVVRGQSAEGLLDQMAGAGGSSDATVQHNKPTGDAKEKEGPSWGAEFGGQRVKEKGKKVDNKASVSGSVGNEGGEIKIQKDLLPPSWEVNVPTPWGKPGAGVWINVKPSVAVSGSAAVKWDGSGGIEGKVTGSVALALKGGIENDALTALVFGGVTLELSIPAVTLTRDKDGDWSIAACAGNLVGALDVGFELKAGIGDYSAGHKWSANPGGKHELVKFGLAGWSEKNGPSGVFATAGSGLHKLADEIDKGFEASAVGRKLRQNFFDNIDNRAGSGPKQEAEEQREHAKFEAGSDARVAKNSITGPNQEMVNVFLDDFDARLSGVVSSEGTFMHADNYYDLKQDLARFRRITKQFGARAGHHPEALEFWGELGFRLKGYRDQFDALAKPAAVEAETRRQDDVAAAAKAARERKVAKAAGQRVIDFSGGLLKRGSANPEQVYVAKSAALAQANKANQLFFAGWALVRRGDYNGARAKYKKALAEWKKVPNLGGRK